VFCTFLARNVKNWEERRANGVERKIMKECWIPEKERRFREREKEDRFLLEWSYLNRTLAFLWYFNGLSSLFSLKSLRISINLAVAHNGRSEFKLEWSYFQKRKFPSFGPSKTDFSKTEKYKSPSKQLRNFSLASEKKRKILVLTPILNVLP
jgi:hypothetical protein